MARGRRRPHNKKQTTVTTPQQEHLAKFPTTNKITISLENNTSVIVVQVDDDEWWTNSNNNDNPHGAKLWPAALATANLLMKYPEYMENKTLIELGCGTGFVSIVAAAKLGARVICTDVSPLALHLVTEGWHETTTTTHQDNDNVSLKGTLETRLFDITSSEPLSTILQDTSAMQPPSILVATAMMYQPQLAKALARRIAQAYLEGVWILVGDDDTGNIARHVFEDELERLLGNKVLSDNKWSETTTVASTELGWRQKNVRILQLNSPLDGE